MQGWRRTMEDAHLVALNVGPDHDTHIFGVFDGHGGREVAVYAKNHFTKIFLNNKAYLLGNIKTALVETFIQIDKEIQTIPGMKELTQEHKKFIDEFSLNGPKEEYALEYDPKKGYIDNIAFNIGCTANVLIMHKNKCYFANAGDSRSIILRKGESIVMSTDHKPDLPNEYERIRKCGGTIEQGRVNGMLNLSRSLGDTEFKQKKNVHPKEQIISCVPDVLYEDLQKADDFVVIACDGIWECMNNEQVSDYIYDKIRNNSSITLQQIVDDMFEKNVAKSIECENGCDNMTCIIIQFKK